MKNGFIFVIILIFLNIQLASAVFEQGVVEPVKYHQFVITGASPIDFYPSDIKTINITIQNVFGYSAYSISTLINPNEVDSIKFTHELQKYVSNEIGPNQNFMIQYEVYIKDNVPKGIYYIPLTILWSTAKDGAVKRQEDLYIGIKVVENPEINLIDTVNITTIPEHIKPGDVFKLKVILKNTGKNNINQIKAGLKVDIPFSSIGSSTEQFIPFLEPGQNAEVLYNLQIDKLAMSRLYNFNFTLEYVDYLYRYLSQQSSFGINAEEQSNAFIQEVSLEPTTINPGSEGLFMVKVINAGTNEIKNVRVTIFGGDKILTQTQSFIGIISPGPKASETASFGVRIEPDIKIGNYGLNIQINYDDFNGKHNSKSNLYVIKVDEKSSLLSISNNTLYRLLYAFIFIAISYGIFLVVGFQLDKKK